MYNLNRKSSNDAAAAAAQNLTSHSGTFATVRMVVEKTTGQRLACKVLGILFPLETSFSFDISFLIETICLIHVADKRNIHVKSLQAHHIVREVEILLSVKHVRIVNFLWSY
jgi:hypothetical protein